MAQDLTKGNPFSVILKFSLPVIGGNLFQLFYTLADTVIVGRTLGADALAAVGSTAIVIYLVLCFIQGITGGFGICLGHRFGARDEKGMRRSVAVSIILCIFFTVIITAICCGLAHQILYWQRTPEKICDMAYDYMFAVLLGTGTTIFYNMISNILRALGDSRTPLIFLIFSSLLNIFLDVVFIVPLQMGVAGAAWATVLSQLLSAVLCTVIGVRKFLILRLKKEDFTLLSSALKIHLSIGFPMGFQMSVMCIGQLAMQGAVNALGTSMRWRGGELDCSYQAALYLMASHPALAEKVERYFSPDGIDFGGLMKKEEFDYDWMKLTADAAHNLFSWNSKCAATPFEISRMPAPAIQAIYTSFFIANGDYAVSVRENEDGKKVFVMDDSAGREREKIRQQFDRMLADIGAEMG